MNARVDLPIDQHTPRVVKSVRTKRVTILAAEPGAGKTTRIPVELLCQLPKRRIIMTQPRRMLITTNGTRIAAELGCKPGELVGWRLAGEAPKVSDDTRLRLIIDQSLINWIIRYKRLPKGIIIVDEAHERSVPGDLLLGLIKLYLPKSAYTNILVMSATIDTGKFSRYFGGAEVIEVPGKCHPVHTEVVRLQEREHHVQGAARVAKSLMQQIVAGGSVPVAGSAATQGSILIPLPGKKDIDFIVAQIADEARRLGAESRFSTLVCSGESTPEQHAATQELAPEKGIRFVVGTVVRSSVTIPDAIGVIDPLQTKRMMASATGVSTLTKIAVSKAEADQARGRAGRTQPGLYLPVSFGDEYETLEPYPLPAMLCEAIGSVLLQIAAADLDVRDFPFIDAPSPEHMDAALARLQKIGALDENDRITNVGRVLVRLSLNPEGAATLLTARELGVLPEAVIVTAVLGVDGIFHRPKDRAGIVMVDGTIAREILTTRVPDASDSAVWYISERRDPSEVDLSILPFWMVAKEGLFEVDCGHPDFPYREGAFWIADEIRAQWTGESQSDFAAIVRAYRAYKAEEFKLKFRSPRLGRSALETLLRNWCMAHSLNFKRLRLAEQAMRQIKSDLAGVAQECNEDLAAEREFDTDALTKALLSGFFDNVAIATGRRQFSSLLGSFGLSRESAAAGAGMVLVGGVRKTLSETMMADLAAPIEIDWLEEMLPHLCETIPGQEPVVDYERREVTSVTEDRFNGLCLWRSAPEFDADLTDETFSQLVRLETEALTLRDRVNVVCEREYNNRLLSNKLYDGLRTFDVDDAMLPTSVDGLQGWIAGARRALGAVENELRSQLLPLPGSMTARLRRFGT